MSRVLLETNAWLWMAADDDRLGPAARSLILRPEMELLLSTSVAHQRRHDEPLRHCDYRRSAVRESRCNG
jgi:PIN domain nuclease of toxin-antitoxin system